jgi:hypothetical protein
MASAKGEAYVESDRDDDDENENRDSDDDADDGCGFDMAQDDDEDSKPAVASTKTHSLLLSGEALQRRLQTLEDENQSALVLVDHREKVAERVLKERKIKVRKGRKWQPMTFDRTSYDQGVVDAKEIDINQRAIRDEIKVKREKRGNR